jgi:hypothetical protein
MKKRIVVAALAALALAGPLAAQSPLPLALQVGTGVVIPTGEFADVAENGAGFNVGTGFQLVPNVAVYGGYSWLRFPSTAFGGDLTDSGFTVGLSAVLPQIGTPRALPWAGIGVVLNRLTIEGAPVQPARGDPGLGLGGGVLIPLTPAIRLSPSVGYVRYSSPVPAGSSLDVSHLSVGVSLNISPWY